MRCRLGIVLLFGVWAISDPVSSRAEPPSQRPDTALVVADRHGPRKVTATAGADFTLAADGVTDVGLGWLDCFNFYGPGTMRLTMTSGPAAEDGGVSVHTDDPRLEQVSIPALFEGGCWTATGRYRVPDEFNRGGDDVLPLRGVTVELRFIPLSGGPAVGTFFIDLVRPPIVFVHGIWSSPRTWSFSLFADPIFPVREPANYESSNAKSFSFNKYAVQRGISEALAKCSKLQIGCSRVDSVGHSMGGLLGRIHTNSPFFATPINRNYGNVRKLVTLDSPHKGSPLATYLLPLLDATPAGEAMRAAFNAAKYPIDQGAIEDLATGSSAIFGMKLAPVPAHALVGIGGGNILTSLPPPLGPYYRILFFSNAATGTAIFGGEQHDALVDRPSQEGGLPSTATSVFDAPDGIHLALPKITPGNTGSEAYASRIRELLDSPGDSSDWGALRSPIGLLTVDSSHFARLAPKNIRAALNTGLTITAPAAGTNVAPGSTVNVSVSTIGPVTVDEVLVVGPTGANSDASAPFEISIEVPINAYGPYPIKAFGKNTTTGDYYDSAEVVLNSAPSAVLESIEIEPLEAFIVGVDDTESLAVVGHFADDIDREVPASLVAFSSSDAGIVSVTADGTATGESLGQTQVHASYLTFTADRAIEVLPPGPLIFADDYESGDLSWWTQVIQ